MSSERKVEKQITWILKFTEDHDGYFKDILEFAGRNGVWPEGHGELLIQLLSCFPKGEKEDEKIYHDLDLNDDDVPVYFDDPGPTVPVGPPPAGRNTGGANPELPGNITEALATPRPGFTKANAAANSEGDVAGMSNAPHADAAASNADATRKLRTLAQVCTSGSANAVDKSEPGLPPKWPDIPNI